MRPTSYKPLVVSHTDVVLPFSHTVHFPHSKGWHKSSLSFHTACANACQWQDWLGANQQDRRCPLIDELLIHGQFSQFPLVVFYLFKAGCRQTLRTTESVLLDKSELGDPSRMCWHSSIPSCNLEAPDDRFSPPHSGCSVYSSFVRLNLSSSRCSFTVSGGVQAPAKRGLRLWSLVERIALKPSSKILHAFVRNFKPVHSPTRPTQPTFRYNHFPSEIWPFFGDRPLVVRLSFNRNWESMNFIK